jgi:hypothetical protein
VLFHKLVIFHAGNSLKFNSTGLMDIVKTRIFVVAGGRWLHSLFEFASVQGFTYFVVVLYSAVSRFEHAITLIESSKRSPRKTTNACFLGPGWKASVLVPANTE